jgi:multidrug resistance efflux pump
MRMDNRDAQMALQQATAEREAARSNLASFRSRLAEANARLHIAQRRAEQVPGRLHGDSPARAQATYDQAKVNYSRAKQLFDSGIIAQQELDGRATELRIAQDDLENAKRQAGASANLEQDQTEQAGLEAQATRQDLLDQLRQADLKYQQAQQRADEVMVRAVQPGVIAEIPVKLGDSIPGGTVLAKVAELRKMIADVPVAATMISQLKSGEPVMVRLPSNPPTQVQGTIRTINPLPSPNMTHNVEVEFENPTLMLLAGQPSEVRFVKP